MAKHAGNRTGREAKRRRALVLDDRQPVLRVTLCPALALVALRWFKAQVYIISPTMSPGVIRVVPLGYAENIRCEIGFSNPEKTN